MAVPRFVSVLVLTVAFGWAMTACTAADEPGLWPTRSPSSSPAPALTSSAEPSSSAPPSTAVEIAHRIPIGDGPSVMVLDPGIELFTSYGGTVSIINIDQTRTGQFPQETLSVGPYSGALAIDVKAGLLYVATENRKGVATIAVLDFKRGVETRTGEEREAKVIDTIVLGEGNQPNFLALDPKTGSLFVLDHSTLRVINTKSRKVTHTIPVGRRDSDGTWRMPLGLAVDPKAGVAIVSRSARSWIIDTKSYAVEGINTGGGGPVTVDSTTSQAFIPNQEDGTVTVVDTTTRKLVKTIRVGDRFGPSGPVAVDPTAGLAYVTWWNDSALAVVDTKTLKVVERIPRIKGEVVEAPLVVDPSTGSLYLASHGSVLVIPRR